MNGSPAKVEGDKAKPVATTGGLFGQPIGGSIFGGTTSTATGGNLFGSGFKIG